MPCAAIRCSATFRERHSSQLEYGITARAQFEYNNAQVYLSSSSYPYFFLPYAPKSLLFPSFPSPLTFVRPWVDTLSGQGGLAQNDT